MGRLVVKSHRPLQMALAIVVLSMFIAIATWLLLDRSHWSLIYDRFNESRQRRLLWEVNQGLEEENTRLRESVMMLERTTALDRQTAAMVQDEITELQKEVFRLKGELEFYQGVMEATGQGKSLDVHGIFVRPLSHRDGYRLKTILTHVVNTDAVAEGVMRIRIEGIQEGNTRFLDLRDVTLDSGLDLTFKFRNFKRFESNLAFPADFSPQRVFVELQPKGQKEANIKKVFDWPESAG
ncbi:MAG: hypothetical protein HYY36_02340 [Gammaproteobacteria bacterium]|nr:hypothetical protein [Gammaproteobacteria bacterium]